MRALIGGTIAIILFSSLYWFATANSRGSTLAWYIVNGRHAIPTGVYFSCDRETTPRVSTKFSTLPSVADEQKDELEKYWYINYFAECLSTKGYTATGEPIPDSIFTTSSDLSQYENLHFKYSFSFPSAGELIADNILNVDYNPSLYNSRIKVADQIITIRSAINRSDFNNFYKNFNTLVETYANDPLGKEDVLDMATKKSNYGVDVLHLTKSGDAFELMFLDRNGHPIIISGSNTPTAIIESIVTTLKFQ